MFSTSKSSATRGRREGSRVPRVLVVDDEPNVREFVTRAMKDSGCDITVAGDGNEALAAAAKGEPFDLLLTDVVMPQMSGDELARRLRQTQPSLKVLYLTGYSDRLLKDKSTLWEDEAFLDKPCSKQGLLEAVSLLLYGHLPPKSESAQS